MLPRLYSGCRRKKKQATTLEDQPLSCRLLSAKWQTRNENATRNQQKSSILSDTFPNILRNLYIQLGSVFPLHTRYDNCISSHLENDDFMYSFISTISDNSAYDLNMICECESEQHLELVLKMCNFLEKKFLRKFSPYIILILSQKLYGNKSVKRVKKSSFIKGISIYFPELFYLFDEDKSNNEIDILIFDLPDMEIKTEFIEFLKNHRDVKYLLRLDQNHDSKEFRNKLKKIAFDMWRSGPFSFWGHNFYRFFTNYTNFHLPNARMENYDCGFTRCAIRSDFTIFPASDYFDYEYYGVPVDPVNVQDYFNTRKFWPKNCFETRQADRISCKATCHLWRWCCGCLKGIHCELIRSIFEGLFLRITHEYITN